MMLLRYCIIAENLDLIKGNMDNLDQIDVNKIKDEIFRETPRQLVAEVIAKRFPDVRVTDKLIESYIDLASSKQFTLDETIAEIRALDSFDSTFEGKVTFVLEDGKTVMLSVDTFRMIKESINKEDIVKFMRKDATNFLNIVDLLEGN